MLRASVLVVLVLLPPGAADASCNVIPSVDRTFPSSLGAASRPFARPGDVVAITRTDLVFATVPAANAVSVKFRPLEEEVVPSTTVGPLPGEPCPSARCAGSRCDCVEFTFPDIVDQLGAPVG